MRTRTSRFPRSGCCYVAVAELLECGVRFLLMLVLLSLQFAMHFALSLSKRIKKINNLNNLLKNIYMPYNQRCVDVFILSKKLINLICKNIYLNYF